MSKKKIVLEKNTIVDLFNNNKFNKISKYSKNIISYYEKDIDICKLVIVSEINLKNYFKAEQYLKKIIDIHNTDELNYLYGNILKIQNKFHEAVHLYKKAISLNKSFSEAYNNLANTQKKLGDNKNAISNYMEAIKSDNSNIGAYFNLANLYRSEKKFDEALNNYKRTLELNPKFVESINNIGSINLILGNFENGLKYLKEAIEIDIFNSEAYYTYSSAKKISEEDPIFLKLKSLIEEKREPQAQNFKMYYALSKSYFDVNNIDLGFKYLKLASNFKLNEIEKSFKKQSRDFKKIKKYFQIDAKILDFSNNFNSTPIFILGMPRSGTSLIEQIISNHSAVYGGGELSILPLVIENSNWKNNENFINTTKFIREEYLSKISILSNKKFITDKLPGNFKWIGFILNSIPESKILHLERNPMAVCWSIYKSNFDNPDMGFTCKQEYIAEFYILYNDLIQYWKSKYPNKFINIIYEEFIEDYENNIKKIFQKLELNWENHLLEFYKNKRPVETSSFQQVRKKIYKNSSEEWKKYKNFLTPMIEILSKNNIKF